MLSKQKIAVAGVALGLVLGGVWLMSHRDGSEEGADVRECSREQLDLREGVLYAKDETAPFTGVLVEYFPGRAKRLAIEIREGRAHGISRGWYENGQLETEEHFVEGVSHGLRTRWYANGAKKSEARIVDGKIEGTFTRWHDNGQMAAVAAMADGVPHGVSQAWYPSGARKSHAVLEAGQVVSREYFDDGGEL